MKPGDIIRLHEKIGSPPVRGRGLKLGQSPGEVEDKRRPPCGGVD